MKVLGVGCMLLVASGVAGGSQHWPDAGWVIGKQLADENIDRPPSGYTWQQGLAKGPQLVSSSKATDKKRCERARERLKRIKSRMRAGYKASESDRLHKRELKARKERQRSCR